MKSILLLAAATAIAGPAAAANSSNGVPPASDPLYASTSLYAGDIELGFTYAKQDDRTLQMFDATGRLAGPLVGWVKGEVEGLGLHWTSDDYSASGFGVIGHLYKQDANYALGLVAGVLSMDNTDETSYGFGIEGQAYLGQNVLSGQLAYASADEDYKFIAVSGQIGHYFNPDLKGTVSLTYVSPMEGEGTMFLASVGAEKRFTCWSLFASGSYEHDSDGNDSDMWGARVGARVFFDQPGTTLQQHDWQVPFNANWLTAGR